MDFYGLASAGLFDFWKTIKEFKMGQRGGARPGAGRKTGEISQAKRDMAEMAKEHAEAALKTLANIQGDKGAPAAARVSAATAILDRAFGKPVQGVTHSGPGGGPIEHSIAAKDMTDDELARIAFGGSNGASTT